MNTSNTNVLRSRAINAHRAAAAAQQERETHDRHAATVAVAAAINDNWTRLKDLMLTHWAWTPDDDRLRVSGLDEATGLPRQWIECLWTAEAMLAWLAEHHTDLWRAGVVVKCDLSDLVEDGVVFLDDAEHLVLRVAGNRIWDVTTIEQLGACLVGMTPTTVE